MDRPLPGGTVEIYRRWSISTIGGWLREKEEEGEEEKGEKREIPALPWFPVRSIARGRFFVGGLPSPLGETRQERRRELPFRERGDTRLPVGGEGRTRHAIQLLSPANIVAKTNGRDKICKADLEEVTSLYLDAKSSARLLQEQQERYIT
ncbi:hypothetical protein GW17_00049614 [Ensete ventricosum]|nr:hypothetical protein GW17_00049614 [Ensete ventricosum]